MDELEQLDRLKIALQGKIAIAESELIKINREIGQANEDLKGIESQTEILQGMRVTLLTEQKSLQEKISSLEVTVKTLTTEIGILTQDMAKTEEAFLKRVEILEERKRIATLSLEEREREMNQLGQDLNQRENLLKEGEDKQLVAQKKLQIDLNNLEKRDEISQQLLQKVTLDSLKIQENEKNLDKRTSEFTQKIQTETEKLTQQREKVEELQRDVEYREQSLTTREQNLKNTTKHIESQQQTLKLAFDELKRRKG